MDQLPNLFEQSDFVNEINLGMKPETINSGPGVGERGGHITLVSIQTQHHSVKQT